MREALSCGRRVILLYCLLGVATLLPVLGQQKNPRLENPRYGADVETRKECLKNTSYYQEFYRQNNFEDAAHSWKIVYEICPRSSENIYIRGLRMIKASIDAEKDPAVRTALIDSMLRIYDRRIEYFNKRSKNLASKGLDLYQYAPERTEEVYAFLNEALMLDKGDAEEQVFLILMQATKDMYLAKKLSADSVISTYSRLSTYMNEKLEHQKSPEDKDRVKAMSEAMDGIFTSTGVANCDNLISIYTPRLEASPNDVALARQAYQQLAALRCTDADVYLKAAEVLFKDKPDAMLGRELAKLYVVRRDPAKADEYYRLAFEQEKDSVNRAAMILEYATFVGTTMGEVSRARSLALEALKLDPKLGLAYFFVGTLYAGTRNCGANALANASVFWAAVDKFIQAKNVDPSLTNDCNQQIANYSQYFPSKEEIFFQDLEVGANYRVPCWINENTTIRSRD